MIDRFKKKKIIKLKFFLKLGLFFSLFKITSVPSIYFIAYYADAEF
jgi:hypothetical protein